MPLSPGEADPAFFTGRLGAVAARPVAAPGDRGMPAAATPPTEPTVTTRTRQGIPIMAPAGVASRAPLTALSGMAELLRESHDLERLRNLEARLQFHVVHVPAGGKAVCREFRGPANEAVEAVTGFLQTVIGSDSQVFIFLADRWNLTRGPMKFLVPPPGMGDRIPLFQTPDELQVDLDGGTGLDPTTTEDSIREDEVFDPE